MTEISHNVLADKKATRQAVLTRRDSLDPQARQARSLLLCQQLHTMLEDALTPASSQTGAFEGPCSTTCSTTSSTATQSHMGSIPTLALYSAMKSEVDLAPLALAASAAGWNVCYPLMLEKHEIIPYQTGSMAFFTPPQKTSRNKEQLPIPAQLRNLGSSQVPLTCNPTPSSAFASPDEADEILAQPLRRHTVRALEETGFTYVTPSGIDAIIVPLVAFDDDHFRLGYGGGNYDTFLPQLREDCLVIGVAFEEQRVDAVPREPHDLPLPSILAG